MTDPDREDRILETRFENWLLRLGLGSRQRPRVVLPMVVAVLVAWVPLLILSAIGGQLQSFLGDAGTHVKLLLALPILFGARPLAQNMIGRTLRIFRESGAIRPEVDPKFEAILDRTERLRDSKWALALVFVLALIAPLLVVIEGREFGAESWARHPAGGATPAGLYLLLVSLVLLNLVRMMWIWKWILWFHLMYRASRLDLRLSLGHPDRCGGISMLGRMPMAFAPVMFGLTTVMASRWTLDILAKRTTLEELTGALVVSILIVALILVGPLLTFTPALTRFRFLSIMAYNRLAVDYGNQFSRRWIAPLAEPGAESSDELLGSGDIQSFADIAAPYERIRFTSFVPFTVQQIVSPTVLACLPFLAVVITTIPLSEILKRVLGAVL